MKKKNQENQFALELSSESKERVESDSQKFENYIKGLNSTELKRLVESADTFIDKEVIEVLNASEDPDLRRLVLTKCQNHPEIGKRIEIFIERAIFDKDQSIRNLALDMSLSINLWIKNLKSARTNFTQKMCFLALNDTDANIRSKAAFYTLKLPKDWKKESESVVLAGFAKNPYLSVKDRKEVAECLVNHNDFRVRYALSSNSSIKNPLIISKLARDTSSPVRAVLSLNPDKGSDTENYLAKDKNPLVLYLLSISCSHQNSKVLRKVIKRTRSYIQTKFLELNAQKIFLLKELGKPSLEAKARKKLEKKLSAVNSILEDEAKLVELDIDKSDSTFFSEEADLDFHHWNALHLMGLENQHLNDSSISISQIIWKCSIKNSGIKEIKFWQYIDRILCKPFLLNTFGDNPEIDFLTQMTKEEYGRS